MNHAIEMAISAAPAAAEAKAETWKNNKIIIKKSPVINVRIIMSLVPNVRKASGFTRAGG